MTRSLTIPDGVHSRKANMHPCMRQPTDDHSWLLLGVETRARTRGGTSEYSICADSTLAGSAEPVTLCGG